MTGNRYACWLAFSATPATKASSCGNSQHLSNRQHQAPKLRLPQISPWSKPNTFLKCPGTYIYHIFTSVGLISSAIHNIRLHCSAGLPRTVSSSSSTRRAAPQRINFGIIHRLRIAQPSFAAVRFSKARRHWKPLISLLVVKLASGLINSCSTAFFRLQRLELFRQCQCVIIRPAMVVAFCFSFLRRGATEPIAGVFNHHVTLHMDYPTVEEIID